MRPVNRYLELKYAWNREMEREKQTDCETNVLVVELSVVRLTASRKTEEEEEESVRSSKYRSIDLEGLEKMDDKHI